MSSNFAKFCGKIFILRNFCNFGRRFAIACDVVPCGFRDDVGIVPYRDSSATLGMTGVGRLKSAVWVVLQNCRGRRPRRPVLHRRDNTSSVKTFGFATFSSRRRPTTHLFQTLHVRRIFRLFPFCPLSAFPNLQIFQNLHSLAESP